MIDIQTEQLLRLHDARKLPWLRGRSGGRADIGTLRRWAMKGIGGIVLETVRMGSTHYTSVEACLRFIERLSVPATSPTVVTTAQRARAIAAADKKLDQVGLT